MKVRSIEESFYYEIEKGEEFDVLGNERGFYLVSTVEGRVWLAENSFEVIVDESEFSTITNSLASLLEYKNEKYGNAVLSSLDVFTGKCKAGTRIDDKLSRVKNGTELRKNDIADLIGYLVLTCKENGWDNFDEFKD